MFTSEDSWAKDESTKNCIACGVQFTLVSRRHHCRSCAQVYCNACSAATQPIPGETFMTTAAAESSANETAEPPKRRVCTNCNEVIKKVGTLAAAASSALVGANKRRAMEEYKVAAHHMLLISDLPAQVRNHIYVANAARLQNDLAHLRERMRVTGQPTAVTTPATNSAPSAGRADSEGAAPRTPRSPQARQATAEVQSAAASCMRGAALEYVRSVEHDLLCVEAEAIGRHTVDVAHVLGKNSLTAFFHRMHGGLATFLFRNRLFALQGGRVPSQLASLKLGGADYTVSAPSVAAHFDALLDACARYTALAAAKGVTPLVLAAVTGTQLERIALQLTRRYEEAVVCLDEAGAVTLAESMLARVLVRFTNIGNDLRGALAAPIFEMVCEAIATSSLPPRALSTRVPDVDSGWTDHDVIHSGGIITADGFCYEHPSRSAPHRFYYRLGTVAEARGLGMRCIDRRRAVPSPVQSAPEQVAEIQLLVAQRAALYASYASCRFESEHFSHWAGAVALPSAATDATESEGSGEPASTTSPTSPPFSANRRGSSATREQAAPLHSSLPSASLADTLQRAVNTCADFLASPSLFQTMLLNHYTTAAIHIDALSTRITRLSQKVADVATGAHVSDEVRGYLKHVEGLRENADPGARQRAAMFDRFRRIVSPTQTATLRFYVHLRLKLIVTFLTQYIDAGSASQAACALLAGVKPPRSPRVATLVDTIVRSARFNPATQTWSVSDIVDRHCDFLARALTERFQGVSVLLSEAGVLTFAELCVVRLFHLIDGSTTPQQVEACSRVSIVQFLERVTLADTFVKWKKVYLPSQDGSHTLSEHGLHVKGGVISTLGDRFIGDENGPKPQQLPAGGAIDVTKWPPLALSPASVTPKLHHRPHKYGFLMAWSTTEIAEKALLPATETWTRSASPHPREGSPTAAATAGGGGAEGSDGMKKKKLSFFSRSSSQKLPPPPPPMIKSKRDERRLHWGSSVLSAGPRLVVAGDTVGVTLHPRNREGAVLMVRRGAVRFVIASDAAARASISDPSAQEGDSAATTSSAVSPARTVDANDNVDVIHGACTIATAGQLIVGALFDGVLLIANAVTVQAAVVDWAGSGSILVTPHVCRAGEEMRVTLTLRDAFGNLTTSTNPEEFAICITNECEIVQSTQLDVTETGSFGFAFVPIADAPVDIAVTVGGHCRHFDLPLRCFAAKPDFKSTLLSFDEVDVEAGTVVNGNLLLRDVYGNRAASTADKSDGVLQVELLSGGRIPLALERVHESEFIFSFTPTRHGTAIVRVFSSGPSPGEVIGKINVRSPQKIDWENSTTVSCVSKVAFAGERATFNIMPRDRFGNPVSGLDLSPSEFHCVLQYQTDPDVAITVDNVCRHEDSKAGIFFTFSAVVTKVGTLVAAVTYEGQTRESGALTVLPASLCWTESRIIVPKSAVVGEWVTVQIECFDRFRNPSPAHAADFSVSVENTQDEASAALVTNDSIASAALVSASKPKTKTVAGANCSFGFQFLATCATTARVAVTYVGHNTNVALVEMLPAAIDWTACTVVVDVREVRAGEPASCTITFRDTFGNLAPAPPPSAVRVQFHNQGAAGEVTECVSGSDAFPGDPAAFARLRFITVPEKAGHVHFLIDYAPAAGGPGSAAFAAVAAASSSSQSEPKKTAPVAVNPNETDWASCVLTSSAGSKSDAIAGLPIVVTMQLVDRFNNPSTVSRVADFVDFAVFNFAALPAAEDADDPSPDAALQLLASMDEAAAVAVGTITRPSPSSLAIQFVPERAGVVVIFAKQQPETPAPLAAKLLRHTVSSSTVDWLGKTRAAAPEVVVAGVQSRIVVRLRDIFDNPVLELKPSQLSAHMHIATRNPRWAGGLPAGAEKVPLTIVSARALSRPAPADSNDGEETLEVLDGDAPSDVMLCDFRAECAGTATIALALQGVERVPISISVVPAGAEWSRTVVDWQTQLGIAGTECSCAVRFRDAFDNPTNDGHPSVDEIGVKATLRLFSSNAEEPATVVVVDKVRVAANEASEEATPYIVVCSTERRGDLSVSLSLKTHAGDGDRDDGHAVETPAALQIDPAPLVWEGCTFAWTCASPTATLVAGAKAEAMLTLRDAFGNLAFGIKSATAADVITALAGPAIALPTPVQVTAVSPGDFGNGDTSRCSTFTVSFEPRTSGAYTLRVALAGDDTDDVKALPCVVTAGPVCWPARCTLGADAEVVPAGYTLLFELMTCDEFGNATSVGVDPAKITILTRAVGIGSEPNNFEPAEGVAVSRLPHHDAGLYSFTFEPRRRSTIEFAARFCGVDGELVAAAPVRVVPASPDWEQAKLVAGDEAATVGVATYISLVLHDAFGNVIAVADADDAETAVSVITEDLQLTSAAATNNGAPLPLVAHDPATLAAPTVAGDAANAFLKFAHKDAARVFELVPEKTGSMLLSLHHTDSDVVHQVTLDVLPGTIHSGRCVFAALPSAPMVVTAGSTATVRFELRDVFGNAVPVASPAMILADCRTTVGATEHVVDATLSAVKPSDNNEFVVQFTPTVATTFTMNFRTNDDALLQATPAGAAQASSAESLSSPLSPAASSSLGGSRRERTLLGSFTFDVRHAKPHAPKCAIAAKSASVCAGDEVVFTLMLFDAFGNVVNSFTNGADGRIVAKNGTTNPPVTFKAPCSSAADASWTTCAEPNVVDGAITFGVVPCELGKVHCEFDTSDAAGAAGAASSLCQSQAVTVMTAPVHWPSCALKIVEDQVKLGEEATLIITAKDRFGNSAAAKAEDFTVRVVGDQHATGDAAAAAIELLHMGKTFVAHFKPLERGPLQFEVSYAAAPDDPRRTDISRVV